MTRPRCVLLTVERAAEAANEADGPLSAPCYGSSSSASWVSLDWKTQITVTPWVRLE
jgi:hypothetical protein